MFNKRIKNGILFFLLSVCMCSYMAAASEEPEQEVNKKIESVETGESDNSEEAEESENLEETEQETEECENSEEIEADQIPAEMLEFAEKYPEAAKYVEDYPIKHLRHHSFDLTHEIQGDKVPLFIQWDERWGYESYGSGLIGYTGCGPTCLSMVVSYLTKNPEYHPIYMANFAQENDYYIQDVGTDWSLMEYGCEYFGIYAETVPMDEGEIKYYLDQNCPIICSMHPGDFTYNGHFIVLTGYDEKGIYVNDPNSRERSKQAWDPEVLLPQIRNMWAYQKYE